MKHATVALLALLALAACSTRTETIPEPTLAAWEIGFNAGDAPAVAAVYAEDAILMPPGAPALKGRGQIEKYMQNGFAQGPAKIALTTDDLTVKAGTGVKRGTYVISAPDGTEIEKGKYLEIWKKDGEHWLMSVDIWNTDAPPPPPAPLAPDAPPPPDAPPAPSAS